MKKIVSFCCTAIVVALMTQEGSAATCERENLFGQTTYFNCPQPTDPERNRYCCGDKDSRYCCDSPLGLDDELVKKFAEKSSDSDSDMPTAHALKIRKFAKKNLEALAQVQETPISPETANDQEGVRDTVRAVGGKLNPKVGVQKAKDKVKQKIEDKVKEKAVKKLDPTGGHIKSLPVILGVVAAIIIGLIVLCIVCCCCCPFCLLHKRRTRGAVHHPNTADVTVTQPLQPMPPQQYPGQQPYAPQAYPAQPYPPQQQYPPQQGYPAQPGYPQQPYPPHGNQPAVYPDLTEQ